MLRSLVVGCSLALLVGCAGSKPKVEKQESRVIVTAGARAASDKLYFKGVEQYLKGDLKGAASTWDRVLEMNPYHRDAKRSLTRTRQELIALKKRGN